MRDAILLFLALCLLASCTAPPVPAEADPYPRGYERPAANAEAQRLLSLPVTLIEGELTLNGLAELLERDAGVRVRFDWEGLAKLGISPASSLAVRDGAAPAERVLSMALWHLYKQDRGVYPTYMLVDGVVVIGTNVSLVRQLPQVNWPSRGKPAGPKGASVVALTALKRTVEIEVQGVRLDLLFEYARDTSGANIAVNWPELKRVGVEQGTEVDVVIYRGSVADLLNQALHEASGSKLGAGAVGYTIHEGVVVVSTRQDLWDNYNQTVSYDVRDLIERPYGPTLTAMYADDPFALKRIEQYDLAWHLSWMYDPDFAFDEAWPSPNEFLNFMASDREIQIGVIRDAIAREVGDRAEWLDPPSRIEVEGNTMTVRTREDNHREIEDLLIDLRQHRRERILRVMREVEAARWLRRAVELRREGDLRGALQRVEQALVADPGNWAALAMRLVLEEALSRE